MDLHLLPLSATDIESDSDYLATPVDTPYGVAQCYPAQRAPRYPPDGYRSPPAGSSASPSSDASATRGAPHVLFAREPFVPAAFGQSPHSVPHGYSGANFTQRSPSVLEAWASHGHSDLGEDEATPWITRHKFQDTGSLQRYAHVHTPEEHFDAEPPYGDTTEAPISPFAQGSYNSGHPASSYNGIALSQHFNRCGLHEGGDHVPYPSHSSSSSFCSESSSGGFPPSSFQADDGEASDDALRDQVYRTQAYDCSNRLPPYMSGAAPPDDMYHAEEAMYYQEATEYPGDNEYVHRDTVKQECLQYPEEGLMDAGVESAWAAAHQYDHHSAQAHAVSAYHGSQPIHRRSFMINLHRSDSPSCPYVYPHVEELPSTFPSFSPSIHAPQPHPGHLRSFDGCGYPDDEDDLLPPSLAPAYRVLSIPSGVPPMAAPRQPMLVEDSPKKPLTLACFFCRKRKIACGSPPAGRKDRTCNQCARRNLKCVYPHASRRGMRPKNTCESDTVSPPAIPALPRLP